AQVPLVSYNGTAGGVDIRSCDSNTSMSNSTDVTPVDGLSPVFSSASTTSPTTIDVVFTETVTAGNVGIGNFVLAGTSASLTGSPSISGNTVTLSLDGAIKNTDTPTITYTENALRLNDANSNFAKSFSDKSITNNVATKGSALGCGGDCTSPTIGLDKYGIRSVDGGFSYNGNTVDVLTHHTPFPLISAQIGKTNTVTVKVFDEYGTQGLRLVQFGLGLPEIGSPLDNAESIISIWFEYGGSNIEEIKITDKHNLIENSSVKIQTEMVDCREGSAAQCTEVKMKYKYREASIYNVMRVSVMDNTRNVQTTNFNEGIEVLGESMNPADKLNIIPVTLQQYPQKRGLVELTQIDRSEKLWTDPYGYIWQGDQSKMVLISTIPLKEKDNDPKSIWSGYNDRINSNFAMYKQEQIDKAQEVFDILYMNIQGDDLTNYVAETMNYGIVRDRANDSVLQQALIDEANRAELVLKELLSKTHRVNMVND
ncbi:MAG: Ig-like domain-containing protein, partial [Nitrosopumilus sp.]